MQISYGNGTPALMESWRDLVGTMRKRQVKLLLGGRLPGGRQVTTDLTSPTVARNSKPYPVPRRSAKDLLAQQVDGQRKLPGIQKRPGKALAVAAGLVPVQFANAGARGPLRDGLQNQR